MDEAAFEALVAPHRAALEAHCYRMLGSVHDAEDVVQESLLRAWKAADRYDPARPVRPWLFAIATNRCLTLLDGRARREQPEPYPDARLEASAEDAAVAREGIKLAFVTALQELPPRQRAALLLCEVLSFPAAEAAGILATTTASVTSALQRARRTLDARPAPAKLDEAARDTAARYAAAWEAGDVDAIVAMLAADARYSMPPLPESYAGRDAIRAWLLTVIDLGWRFLPTRANGQPAFGTYYADGDGWVAIGLDVLTIRDGSVTEVVSHLDAGLFPVFDLPMRIPAAGGTRGMTDEEEIRALILRWAAAVHSGDLPAVLADHADDIVMFDVPPPQEGVRGIDAYRETWPPFFEWQASGAVFDVLELDVTAGEDVAFARALLRCGTSDDPPEQRLRLTVGLRKQDGRWVVVHEHHSFPDESDATAEETIRKIHRDWTEATAANDLDGLMAHIDADVVSYEHDAPLAYVGRDAVRESCRRGLEAAPPGPGPRFMVPDLQVAVQGDLAVAWGLNRISGGSGDEWSRGTRVFRRRPDGSWAMVHQHVSYPYDAETGQARTDLTP